MTTTALISLFLFAIAVTYGSECGTWGGCRIGSCCSKWGWCGNDADHCGAGCLSSCGSAPPLPPPPPLPLASGCNCPSGQCCSQYNYCGTTADYCGSGCKGGPCYGGSPSNTPSNPPPKPPPATGGSGSISSLVSQGTFNAALSSCGINNPGLYSAFVSGFTAPLAGGLVELALLMGNTAHESGNFIYTEEIACAGVTQVTANCPYGLYHGRGYIQISWNYNYQAAASYLGNPSIFSNPDIVKNDATVNMQTVQWFWVNSVQPVLRSKGYTMGASVRAINGGLECDSGPISSGRVTAIQCFQRALGVPVDYNTRCPSAAVGDSVSVFSADGTQQIMPAEGIALIALGSVIALLTIVVAILLVLLQRRSRFEQKI